MDWGKKKIVPLNINEEPCIEDGKKKTGYRADLVKKVDEPLTVTTSCLQPRMRSLARMHRSASC